MERKGGGLSDKLRNLYIIKTLRIKDPKIDTVVGEGERLLKRIRSDGQSAHKSDLKLKYESKTYESKIQLKIENEANLDLN